jgi:5-methylcytosine-specific restriction endonuclease McrA
MNIINRIAQAIGQFFKKESNEEITEFFYNENELDLEAFTATYSPPLVIKKPTSDRRITFEFIPEKQNFKNVRSALQFIEGDWKGWKKIRDKQEEESNGACCICGRKSHDHIPDSKTATECHEVWSFENGVQKLERLEALCVLCHQIKHINRFSNDKNYTEKLLSMYCDINNLSISAAIQDLEKAKNDKQDRRFTQYQLDMSLINEIYKPETFPALFNPHTADFNYFIDNEFKTDKNIEE